MRHSWYANASKIGGILGNAIIVCAYNLYHSLVECKTFSQPWAENLGALILGLDAMKAFIPTPNVKNQMFIAYKFVEYNPSS